ncbi:hypothetical protein AVEN_41219-1 [Araneus ventricosus]|uniref:Uncharacterized protein n=1 Tax=Araneus ventricosus TaxID=182803 RepID=A0A4Y2W276_ARAVE|nr:hypothetical protein AVEN_41219-1 [Araneus ventricosus]
MMLQIGQHIYMFEKESMVDIFDIVEEVWLERELPSMPSDDGWTITLGERLYHIEQSTDSNGMISRYDFESNIWEIITTSRDYTIMGGVALKDQIFVVGCSDEDDEVMMCQAYNPEKNTWISLPAPNINREDYLLLTYHEQVLLIPANHFEAHPKIIEVYNPNQNTWISLPELPFQYLHPKAVIVDDKILVYENNEEEGRRYQEVDPPVYWDESAEIWKIIDKSSPWFHIERYSVLLLDDSRVVKDITAKGRRPGIKWERIFTV